MHSPILWCPDRRTQWAQTGQRLILWTSSRREARVRLFLAWDCFTLLLVFQQSPHKKMRAKFQICVVLTFSEVSKKQHVKEEAPKSHSGTKMPLHDNCSMLTFSKKSLMLCQTGGERKKKKEKNTNSTTVLSKYIRRPAWCGHAPNQILVRIAAWTTTHTMFVIDGPPMAFHRRSTMSWVRYTFIQIAEKPHPKTLSSKNTFIQKHIRPKQETISSTTISSKNGFIQ